MSLNDIYERHVKGLSAEEQLRLIELIARNIALRTVAETKKRSIMELHGLGKKIWGTMDAQKYVNELRTEWDHRP
ncbi:MAG: hypothetical protein C4326_06700 [Ignavibacteria bacterium]